MGYNKVVYAGKTLIDLTGSTVTPETLVEGVVAYNSKGERIVGTLKRYSLVNDGGGNLSISDLLNKMSASDDTNGNVTVSEISFIDDGDGNVSKVT